MPRTKEQAALYMRAYRRRKRLEKAGVTPIKTDPHLACDKEIAAANENLKACQAEMRRLTQANADLAKEVDELTFRMEWIADLEQRTDDNATMIKEELLKLWKLWKGDPLDDLFKTEGPF